MAFSIDDAEAEALLQELASQRGVSLEEAVRLAVRMAVENDRLGRSKPAESTPRVVNTAES
ncbi:MAG: type II toxin-antitoxin system VapB family antitoxin [Rhizobiaceae bacterium]